MEIFFVLFKPVSKMVFNTQKKIKLKIDSAASTGNHKKCMKCVSYPWPPVGGSTL
jgi:hypothetical protein